jgi:hypothetical protein
MLLTQMRRIVIIINIKWECKDLKTNWGRYEMSQSVWFANEKNQHMTNWITDIRYMPISSKPED